MRTETDDFKAILDAAKEIGRDYPDGAILIGGIAVYLHATAQKNERLREATHDADLLISIADFSALRDQEEVVPNPRLGKSQVTRHSVDFDLYVEHQHSLSVKYDEAKEHSVVYEGVRLAALEHLMVLKLDAAIDRAGSFKGDKDNRDVARIMLMLGTPRPFVLPYLSEKRLAKLSAIAETPAAFNELADGNSFEAASLRRKYELNFKKVKSIDMGSGPSLGL